MADPLIMFAALFERMDETCYRELTNSQVWSSLVKARYPKEEGAWQSSQECPNEVIFPSYESYRHFANRILIPGIPGSLPPIGSFYRGGSSKNRTERGYLSEHALHIKTLCEQLEITLPRQYQASPDHLSILLELLSFLHERASKQEVEEFIASHFDWLVLYQKEILARAQIEEENDLQESLFFYHFLVELLMRTLPVIEEKGAESEKQ